MNESKCPHCGEPMVWVGDMLTGGLECQAPLCLGPVVEEPSIMGAGHSVAIPDLVYKQYVNHGINDRPGVDCGAVAESIRNTNDIYKSQNPYAAAGAEAEEQEYLGERINDRLNFDARRSGRTHRMLCYTLDAKRSAIIVVNKRQMIQYVRDILVHQLGCALRDYGDVITEYGCVLKIVEADSLRNTLLGWSSNMWVVAFDHAVPRKYVELAYDQGFTIL